MASGLLMFLVFLIVVLLVAWIVTYVIQRFIPIDPAIKQIATVVIWAVALIAILLRAIPLLSSLPALS